MYTYIYIYDQYRWLEKNSEICRKRALFYKALFQKSPTLIWLISKKKSTVYRTSFIKKTLHK